MSDVISQLEQIIAGIEARTAHAPMCGSVVGRFDAEGMYIDHVCDCAKSARVRTEIARTIERMIQDAMFAVFNETWTNPGKIPTPAEEHEIYKSGRAAAVRAAGLQ